MTGTEETIGVESALEIRVDDVLKLLIPEQQGPKLQEEPTRAAVKA